ncbi:hypothetical protein AGMMS49928_28850 [Spirochaetia bacterium]|nr:hypothetical protein AGMMS49928_28850 [Spirochaetia bacterium]
MNVGTPSAGSITGTGAANTLSFTVSYLATTGTKGITINVFVNEDDTLMTSGGSASISRTAKETLTVTVAEGLTGIQWSLNGEDISGARGTGQSITFDAVDYPARTYNLGLRVFKGSALEPGAPYSTNFAFTVTN